jgi:hypothetical protein
MSRARVRLAATLSLAAGVALGVAPAASGSTDPGWTPTQVTPAPPVQSPHVYCQYEVQGRVVSVGLPLGVKGHGEGTVVEVTRPYSAASKPMPRKGFVRFEFPLRLAYSDVKSVTWAGHTCGVA